MNVEPIKKKKTRYKWFENGQIPLKFISRTLVIFEY